MVNGMALLYTSCWNWLSWYIDTLDAVIVFEDAWPCLYNLDLVSRWEILPRELV